MTKMQSSMVLDARSLDALRDSASRDQAGSVRQATRQFEAMFTQQLLSQMRQTSLAGNGSLAQALDSPAAKTWHQMLDQELAQKMAGVAGPGDHGPPPQHSGLGLADMMEKQLTRQTVTAESVRRAGLPLAMSTLELARRAQAAQGGGDAAPASAASPAGPAPTRRVQNGKFGTAPGYGGALRAPAANGDAAATQARDAAPASTAPASPEEVRAEFLGRFLPAARRAEAVTGIPAAYILGQAALESGWGRREIKSADGRSSHNLFGIKATAGWNGDRVQTRTTEYRNGQAQRTSASFRAYDSYEDAFEDYARLLASNPRYANALKSTGSAEQFAQGLQRAGYATDPRYAQKLASTIRHAMRVVV